MLKHSVVYIASRCNMMQHAQLEQSCKRITVTTITIFPYTNILDTIMARCFTFYKPSLFLYIKITQQTCAFHWSILQQINQSSSSLIIKHLDIGDWQPVSSFTMGSLHKSSLSFFFKALASIKTLWLGSTLWHKRTSRVESGCFWHPVFWGGKWTCWRWRELWMLMSTNYI